MVGYPFFLATEAGERFIILISCITLLTGAAAVARYHLIFRLTLGAGLALIAIFQAVIGIFYVAVIIARLVGARLADDVSRETP